MQHSTFRTEFLNSSYTDVLRQRIFVPGTCSLNCRVFSNIQTIYTLDTVGCQSLIKNNSSQSKQYVNITFGIFKVLKNKDTQTLVFRFCHSVLVSSLTAVPNYLTRSKLQEKDFLWLTVHRQTVCHGGDGTVAAVALSEKQRQGMKGSRWLSPFPLFI